jgi:Zn-dependent peptidase ImmA (M78 family)
VKSDEPKRAPAKKPVRPAKAGVPRDAIERRAYEIYVLSGAQHGFDLDHWLQSERELNAAKPRKAKTAPATRP